MLHNEDVSPWGGPQPCPEWNCTRGNRWTCKQHCHGRLDRYAAAIGELTIQPDMRTFISVDTIARDVLAMPESQLPYEQRPKPQMLDAAGHEYPFGAVAKNLSVGVPFTAIRAIRWKPRSAWRWYRYVATLSPNERVDMLLQQIPAREVHVFDCSLCPGLTTAVAECGHCARQLCLTCWITHPGCHARPRQIEEKVRCPVSGARLHRATGLGAQVDIHAWCSATRSLRAGPCWPECTQASVQGWLTASGRIRLPDGNQ